MSESAKLVKPQPTHKEAFIRLINDYKEHDEIFYYDMYKVAQDDFQEYINKLEDHSNGVNVPEDWVSGQTFWLETAEGEIAGNIRVRDELKGEFLKQAGGHIGYDISPKYRKLGYGNVILKQGLIKAKERGLSRVLVACDDTNTGSRKIIENNGGVYHSSFTFEDPETTYLRYWIEL